MVAMAFGTSISGDDGHIVESISASQSYIEISNCSERKTIDRVTRYHRKCIAAMKSSQLDSTAPFFNSDSIVSILVAGVRTAFLQRENPSIYIRTTVIENGCYIKHQFNAISSGYFFNLYMEM